MSQYQCEGCGKELSKSGYYKHRKKCPDYIALKDLQETPQPTPKIEEETVQFSDEAEDIEIEEEAERPDWFDWDSGESDEATEHFPTALKMVAGQGASPSSRNPSKAQIEAMHNTNLNMLIMGLGGVDMLIQSYGRAVTLDDELTVRHSESDKEMVAHAQYNWMLEKGINPSRLVSTGSIAAALTTYYVVPPILKIRKKSKIKLASKFAFRKTGNFLSKIPLIGRLFKKRPTAEPIPSTEGEPNEQAIN